jgi:hypothetical protein
MKDPPLSEAFLPVMSAGRSGGCSHSLFVSAGPYLNLKEVHLAAAGRLRMGLVSESSSEGSRIDEDELAGPDRGMRVAGLDSVPVGDPDVGSSPISGPARRLHDESPRVRLVLFFALSIDDGSQRESRESHG